MEAFICPRHLTHSCERFEPTHLVSLLDPGSEVASLRPSWIPPENHFSAFFLDSRNPSEPGGPTPDTLRPLIDWLRAWCGPDSCHRLLIHCHAGLGRSPAVGYLAWALHFGVGREDEAWMRMRQSCYQRWILPNPLIIEYGAHLLGRHPALIGPYKRWSYSV